MSTDVLLPCGRDGSTEGMAYIPRGTPMRHLPDVELRHSFDMTNEGEPIRKIWF